MSDDKMICPACGVSYGFHSPGCEGVPDDAPAWRDRPTVPGWYVRTINRGWMQLIQLRKPSSVKRAQVDEETRFYGPIPPDPQTKGGA